nr:hypothetical protein [Pseudomonadota bacterium]
MRAALSQLVPNRIRASPRQRIGAAALAIAIEALIALALFTMSPRLTPSKPEADLKTFSFVPAPEKKAVEKPAKHRVTVAKHASGGASPIAPRAPRDTTPVQTPKPPVMLPGVIPMNLADADISKIRSHAGENVDEGEGAGAGKDSGSVYGPGEGPGGERLFSVAWYREPTHAELAGYLPNGAPPGGWAEIACRMIEHYHVENCRPL